MLEQTRPLPPQQLLGMGTAAAAASTWMCAHRHRPHTLPPLAAGRRAAAPRAPRMGRAHVLADGHPDARRPARRAAAARAGSGCVYRCVHMLHGTGAPASWRLLCRSRISPPAAAPIQNALRGAELIDAAVAAGDVDLGVHSLKDAPVQLPPGVQLAACLPRDDPRDAFISLKAASLGARCRSCSLAQACCMSTPPRLPAAAHAAHAHALHWPLHCLPYRARPATQP